MDTHLITARVKWKLWLDDLRNPADYDAWDFFWARDYVQAAYYVQKLGPPEYMALDHDLGVPVYSASGKPETAMKFLKWLSSRHPDFVPDYSCHSDNPDGVKNINAFMESWKKSLDVKEGKSDK